MLRAFEPTSDRRVVLRQRLLQPCSVPSLWLHSLEALCDDLGIRGRFGFSLGLAAALALTLVGDSVMAAHFGHFCDVWGIRVRFGLSRGLAAALALTLVGDAVVPAHFGHFCDVSGIRVRCGLALGLAAALALAVVGVAVVATLFGRSLLCFGHSVDWRLVLQQHSLSLWSVLRF
jgi:hypothetical protein